jgi:hypothetical protein
VSVRPVALEDGVPIQYASFIGGFWQASFFFEQQSSFSFFAEEHSLCFVGQPLAFSFFVEQQSSCSVFVEQQSSFSLSVEQQPSFPFSEEQLWSFSFVVEQQSSSFMEEHPHFSVA